MSEPTELRTVTSAIIDGMRDDMAFMDMIEAEQMTVEYVGLTHPQGWRVTARGLVWYGTDLRSALARAEREISDAPR
jgi:hypothetical protein